MSGELKILMIVAGLTLSAIFAFVCVFCKTRTPKLQFYRFINSKYGVFGIALIQKGFEAYLRRHIEPETYYFTYGTGKLQINITTVKSPSINFTL